MQPQRNLLIISGLLVLLVGPYFGPLPKYLMSIMALHAATVWLMLIGLIPLGLILAWMLRLMRQQGQTLADLGWGQPSRWLALIVGTLLGLLWGVLGIMGFLHFQQLAGQPPSDPFEISLFRVFTAILGAITAVGEDIITRGYVMHELQRLPTPTWVHVCGSGVLFALYHSVWNFTLPGFVASLVFGLMLSGLFILGKRSLTPVFLAHGLAPVLGEPFLTMSLIMATQTGG